MDDVGQASVPFLDTVNGEIAFFRAITHARPVGINRHFHLLTVQQHIKTGTGQHISVEQLWGKLDSLYNLEILESMVCSCNRVVSYILTSAQELSEPEDSPPILSGGLPSTVDEAATTSEAQRIIMHPHFLSEFVLPSETFEPLIAQRRLRDGPSSADESGETSRHLIRSRSRNAGLVSGDSDSSELTEGDGDEKTSRLDDSEGCLLFCLAD